MSRVVSKESLHKYISMGLKSDMKIWIPVISIDSIYWASLIDSYLSSSCRAICPQVSSYLSSFSEQLFLICFLI